jgi:hypothetical protein
MFASCVTTLNVLDANKFQEIIWRKPTDTILAAFGDHQDFSTSHLNGSSTKMLHPTCEKTEEIAPTFFAWHLAAVAQGWRLAVLQQVVSFLGYTGRTANVAVTAESDPERKCPS